MTFNGSAKSNSIIADIDFLLWSNSDSFNNAYSIDDRTRNVNAAYDEAVVVMYKADPSYKWDDTTNTDIPVATTDLVASQDHYTMLDSMLVISRVRMKDSNGVFQTLTPKLRDELTDDELTAVGVPDKYYKVQGMIFPLPLPDYGAADGVEVEFQRGSNHFSISDTETTPGFNSQFHKFLSIGAALEFAIANDMTQKIQSLTTRKEKMEAKMQEHYQLRSLDDRPRMKVKRRNINTYGL